MTRQTGGTWICDTLRDIPSLMPHRLGGHLHLDGVQLLFPSSWTTTIPSLLFSFLLFLSFVLPWDRFLGRLLSGSDVAHFFLTTSRLRRRSILCKAPVCPEQSYPRAFFVSLICLYIHSSSPHISSFLDASNTMSSSHVLVAFEGGQGAALAVSIPETVSHCLS